MCTADRYRQIVYDERLHDLESEHQIANPRFRCPSCSNGDVDVGIELPVDRGARGLLRQWQPPRLEGAR